MDIINKSVANYREGIAARAQAKAGGMGTPPGSHAPPGTYSGVRGAVQAAAAASVSPASSSGLFTAPSTTGPRKLVGSPGLRSLRPGSSKRSSGPLDA